MTTIMPINVNIPNCFKRITNQTTIPTFSQDNIGKNGIQQFDEQNIQYSGYSTNDYQEKLYKNKKFPELVHTAKEEFCDYTDIFYSIKDNKDFQELCDNACFNTKDGFFNLLRIMKKLKEKRAEEIKKPVCCIPAPPDYAKYDIPDYLRFLNNFAKSNISLDLKKYYIKENAQNLHSYYNILARITPQTNVLELLLAPTRYVY